MEERLKHILNLAMKHHVTDIHLNLSDGICSIEMRVSGIIRQVRSRPEDVRLFHYLMYRANLDLSCAFEPQTGRFEAEAGGKMLALRFAVVSSYRMTSGVLRILNNHDALRVDMLSANPEDLQWFSHICDPQRPLRIFRTDRERKNNDTVYDSQ